MSQELSPCAHQRHPSPEEGARGTPLRRRDRGLGEQTTTKPHGDLLCIDAVVCGFAPVHGLHGEGVAEHKGHILAGAQVGEPVPGAQALDSDDQYRPERAQWP